MTTITTIMTTVCTNALSVTTMQQNIEMEAMPLVSAPQLDKASSKRRLDPGVGLETSDKKARLDHCGPQCGSSREFYHDDQERYCNYGGDDLPALEDISAQILGSRHPSKTCDHSRLCRMENVQ